MRYANTLEGGMCDACRAVLMRTCCAGPLGAVRLLERPS